MTPKRLSMRNLFFVFVAAGVLSGAGLDANAQRTINMEKLNANQSLLVLNDGVSTVHFDNNTNVTQRHNEYLAAIEKCSSLQFKYALLLDIDVEAVTNQVLFEEIEKWWATRYRYGGTTTKGIDCSAYTGTLLSDVYGLNVSRTARAQYAETEKIEREDLQEGDLVFFNTRGGISHVGLYLGNGYFTHAGSTTGVTISNLDEGYWSRKFLRGGRINAITNPETAD